MNKIILAVNGQNYSGWEEVEIKKSIQGLAGSFSLVVSDKYPGKMKSWNFSSGDICEIKVDSELVIKGYIEDINPSYGDTSHSIVISGRDALCDIVDCSYGLDTTEWKNSALNIIVKQLIDVYGIDLIIDSMITTDASAVVPKFVASPVDDVMELVTQLCLHKAILPCGYGDGKLTLTRSGGNTFCKDSLAMGYNILEGGLFISDKDRYSEYTVIGQGTNGENKRARDYVEPVGRANDNVITRNRHLVICSDRASDTGECIKLAEWEARVRAGRSRQYRYKVQGWKQSDLYGGKVWPLNSKVKVKDTNLDIQDTLLISDLSFKMDLSSGTTTTITLVHPDTYELLEQPITQIKTRFDR